jgi:hypothetical protein
MRFQRGVISREFSSDAIINDWSCLERLTEETTTEAGFFQYNGKMSMSTWSDPMLPINELSGTKL